MTPRVTVLMCVYNGERFLTQAIESIVKQTYSDFELLVIDDASNDGTAGILDSYKDSRLRLLRNDSNRGLTVSLNTGLAAARGELVARHDADDCSYPERLAQQVRFLDGQPQAAVVGCQADIIDTNGRRTGGARIRLPHSAAGARFSLMFGSPLIHGATMFRKSVVLDQLGGYNESYKTSQDVELWSRLAASAEIRNLPRRLVQFRVHPQSVSATSYTRANVRAVEKVLRSSVLHWTEDDVLAESWPPLWDAIVNHSVIEGPENPEHAVVVVDQLRERFIGRFPEARGDRDIALKYGAVQLQIASFLASRHSRAAAGALARAVAAAPFAVARWFPRIAGRAVISAIQNRFLQRSR